MKKLIVRIMVLAVFVSLTGCKSSSDPATWSNEKTNRWFENGSWLNGWPVTPDSSINRNELAVSYFRNKERWDRAFTFLKNGDLSKLEMKRYDIDNNNLYTTISEYFTKNEADARFEVHQKYIDIQYVISGTEKMTTAPLSMKNEILVPYDSAKDVEFMTVTQSADHIATPGRFFIFFPSDIHRPSVKVGENSQVRKVVVKVKVD